MKNKYKKKENKKSKKKKNIRLKKPQKRQKLTAWLLTVTGVFCSGCGRGAPSCVAGSRTRPSSRVPPGCSAGSLSSSSPYCCSCCSKRANSESSSTPNTVRRHRSPRRLFSCQQKYILILKIKISFATKFKILLQIFF